MRVNRIKLRVGLAGAALVTAGVAFYSWPAGLMVAGALMIAAVIGAE